eukprot:TRINITY_DN2929_c0_g2_i1.p2 TRINITY_DN2929_c0_g2~~TRINITY_DN2929_c0_g2_i1.p2  ORF type:complete len:466 (-),score=79.58 TRINITY_DN2929_c0_g2_i1:1951-3348(-)
MWIQLSCRPRWSAPQVTRTASMTLPERNTELWMMWSAPRFCIHSKNAKETRVRRPGDWALPAPPCTKSQNGTVQLDADPTLVHHHGMFDLLRTHSRKAGHPPGHAAYVGPEKSFEPYIECVIYTVADMERRSIDISELDTIMESAAASNAVVWVRLVGMHDPSLVRSAGEAFGLHPLQVEDALNTAHRPSLDEGANVLFTTLKAMSFDTSEDRLVQEHVSLVLSQGRCLTLEENPNNPWEALYPRLNNARSRMRRLGADYLFSCLLDTLVDNCFLVVDEIAEGSQALEERLISENDGGGAPALKDIYGMRKELLLFQAAVRPMHEITIRLVRDEQEHFSDEVRPFLRDIRDHAVHVRDTAMLLSTLLENLTDTAISLAGLKLNAVMRVLTVIATIFIPLTFVAGVYGMNFQNMPELHYRYGYYVVLGIMLLIALAMIFYFRIRRWIQPPCRNGSPDCRNGCSTPF